jgi:type VI secretion system secreted protein VgrG
MATARDPLLYYIDLGGRSFRARDLKGEEGVSRPFRFEIRFAEDEARHLDPDALARSDASLKLKRGDRLLRKIDGVISAITVGVARNRATEVHLVFEPHLATARYRTDIRIFRKKTAPEIVVEVLSGLGIKTELRLKGTYERRQYCVQLRETDLDFVHRMMEDEGIFYFFADGDVMVLGDSTAAYEPGGPHLQFLAGSGLDGHEDSVFAIGSRSQMGPSKMTLRDFNPAHPSLDMEVRSETPCPAGPEFYDYPGEYLEPGAGSRKVKLRAEAVACAHAALHGRTFAAEVYPGLVFHLDNAPNSSLEGGLVITRLSHDFGRTEGGFSTAFEALSEDVVYRPPVVTEAPRLLNPMTGIVTGPAGEDIHTDSMGRVKVHFHWDRKLPYDDDCSDWVPVIQDNTGHSVGIPRIGWEVLVHFLEGDPDRPVVLGRVYNADDPFPQRLPDMKTRTALKSLTSPRPQHGTGDLTGTNEIQFEDLAGQERIFMYAEKDQNVNIANDKYEHVVNNESRVVKRDERIAIGADNTQTIAGGLYPATEGNQTWSVSGDRIVHVKESVSAGVQGNRTTKIGGNYMRVTGTDARDVVTQNLKETIGGGVVETSLKNNLVQAELASSLTIGGACVELAKKGKMESTVMKRTEEITGAVFVSAEGSIATRCDDTRMTKVKASMSADIEKEAVLAGLDELDTLSKTGLLQGDKLTLRVGKSEISMKDGNIAVSTSDKITIGTSSDNMLGSGTSSQIP